MTKPKQCPQCLKYFDSNSLRKQHYAAEGHAWGCPLCPTKRPWTAFSPLNNHYLKHHGKQLHACQLCFQVYLDLEALTAHTVAIHSQSNPRSSRNTTAPPQAIPVTRSVPPNDRSYRPFLADIATEASYTCKRCNTTHRSPDALQTHYQQTNVHPKCGVCGKAAYDALLVRSHIRFCHPKCDVCGIYCADLRKHTETKHPPFKCGNCSLTADSVDLLSAHYAVMHLACLQCDKSFISAAGLRMHLEYCGGSLPAGFDEQAYQPDTNSSRPPNVSAESHVPPVTSHRPGYGPGAVILWSPPILFTRGRDVAPSHETSESRSDPVAGDDVIRPGIDTGPADTPPLSRTARTEKKKLKKKERADALKEERYGPPRDVPDEEPRKETSAERKEEARHDPPTNIPDEELHKDTVSEKEEEKRGPSTPIADEELRKETVAESRESAKPEEQADSSAPNEVHSTSSKQAPREPASSLKWGCKSCGRDPEDPVTTICGHLFCHGCIIAELAKSLRCPVCEKAMLVRLHL
ncbi:hypothetical protein BDW22DRAFT_1358969 [Trametopsis cervina]|nr:hypothetical protein BDW22DRAFT_1358969 [Trametopsis cervina]